MTESETGHIPVLLDEVCRVLAPFPGGVYVDATFGAGGYTRAFLDIPEVIVYAIDRDPSALERGRRRFSDVLNRRLFLMEGCFSQMGQLLAEHGISHVDGIVFDLGVSSMHLDDPQRGFSFLRDGPLDMRMGTGGMTAEEIVNTFSYERLSDLFWTYGEEKRSRAIARAIVRRREKRMFSSTCDLAECVVEVYGGLSVLKKMRRHPATLVFQALRLEVNQELDELVLALEVAHDHLVLGGKMGIVTFHSLEDRMVKHFFAEKSGKIGQGSRFLPPTLERRISLEDLVRGGVVPTQEEMERNPRSRSARLRAARRL